MSGSRYLFVDWEGGGNLPPALTLARGLVERGHHVRVLCDPADEADVAATGARFVSYTRAPHRFDKSAESDFIRDWEARGPIDSFSRSADRIMYGPALAYAEDTLEELSREPADALVVNRTLYGGMIAAERAGLPYAVIMPGICELPRPGVPPIGLGLMPARGPLGLVRDILLGQVLRYLYGRGLPQLSEARACLGLGPLGHPWEQIGRATRVLVLTSEAFDFPSRWQPSNARYVGPQLDEPAGVEPWQSPWPEDHPDPLVVVAFSTTMQDQAITLQRVIEALGSLRVRGLVTVGPALNPAAFSAPSNVVVRGSVAHSRVLPKASLVVTHAGHGTVMRALSHGVPLVCLPMGRDQNDNAARVVARGAGLRLSPKVSAPEIRAAIQRVLEQPTYREAASTLATAIERDRQAERGVRELEALLDRVPSPV
jgi:UDP:flavonoid glycosyltransferase YjiC (YdhE family)